jgi:high affinity Mn2+ porin
MSCCPQPAPPRRSRLAALALLAVAAFATPAAAADPPEAIFPELGALQQRIEAEGWLLHGQGTFVLQGNTRFRSPYRGDASLNPTANARNTLSTDLILGRRLWQGAEIVIDTSVTRGFGLTNSVGVAGFPNNEAFRLGSTDPKIFVPRVFFRQVIGLSGEMEEQEDDPLRFRRALPRERITITAGKFSVWDIFDDNRYSHDARTQFLNWALVGAGAFDFTADARGWTTGLALEWENGVWGVRLGAFQVARQANGLFMDPAIGRAWQLIGQVDRFWQIGDRAGAIRVLYGASRTRQSSWGELFANGFGTFDQNPTGYRVKQMVALNMEQALTEELGVFARLSWNDGRTQSWMFTEMDRAVSAGLSLRGLRWDRPQDTVGLATNIGWASRGRQQYLAAGGIGFITGDGRLNYGPEWIAETYYDMRVAPGLNLALDYQFVVNPAYNRDRGPVHLFALRAHAEF